MKTILIIDDDPHIGSVLEEALRAEGYGVLRAYSGTEAKLLLSREKPDLILLDLMLPGLSGEELLPELAGFPVIVMSAKADIDHKVELLEGGAVDYVTKPFALRELVARIGAHLKNYGNPQQAGTLTFQDLRLETDSRRVTAGGMDVKLTRTEYAILKILLQNRTQVVSKSLLLDRISEDTPDCTESSLKIHVSNLRKKLREASGKEYIEAVWGIGFQLK